MIRSINRHDPHQGALDTLFGALICSSVAAYLAGNVLLLHKDVFVSTSLIMLPVVCFWCIFYSLSRTSGSVLLGACLSLLAVWLAVRFLAYGAGVGFAVGGGAAAVHLLCTYRLPKASLTPVAAMALVGAAAALSSPGVFTYFDNLEWAKGRYLHPDVAFHAAIAAVIKNYGVVSTGLNGVVETPYYVLLHHFAALVSYLSGQGTLAVWGVLLYVFCLPLLIFAVCYAAAGIATRDCVMPVAWSLVCFVLVSPQLFVGKWMALQFLFFSETYVLSVALLLLGVPLLTKAVLRWPDVILAAVATAVIAYAKGTTAVIWVGLLGARWLISEKAKFGAGLAAAVCSLFVVAVFIFGVSKSAEASQGGLTTDILHIVRMGPGGAAVGEVVTHAVNGQWPGIRVLFRAAASTLLFFATHFALSWIALALLAKRGGWRSLYTDPLAVLVWSSALGGIFFAVFFTSPGGVNIWYFTSIAFFVALPTVIGMVVGLRGLRENPKVRFSAVAVVLLIILGTSYHAYYRQSFLAPLRRELPGTDLFVAEMLALRRNTPTSTVLRAAKEAWVIEPSYSGARPDQYPAPFVFVALSERAWVNIIRPLDSGGYPHRDYGFAFYGIGPTGFEDPVPAVIPDGAEIRDWSPSRELLEAESQTAVRIAGSWRKLFGHGEGAETMR